MWQPEEDSLKMLVDLLNESQVPNNEKQRQIHNKITELSSNPEFSCYLVYILSLSSNTSINTLRRIAGAILKGVIERNFDKVSSQNLDFIKLKLMEVFNDPAPMIRTTVANAITALFTKIGFQNWPELMKFLILNLDVDHQEYVEGSLECTYKILEDIKINTEFNYQDEKYQNFAAELIPKLLYLCDPKIPPKIKSLSIGSLNLFVESMPAALANTFALYYEMLIVSAQDQNGEVRLRSCEGFLEVLETRKDMILQFLQKTLEKMLQLSLDPEVAVKKSSCRFWSEFLAPDEQEGAEERIEALRECLEILVPALFGCLNYTEEDILNSTEERYEMTRPPKTRASYHSDGYQSDSRQDAGGSTNEKYSQQGAWTLRREAILLLISLAERFKDEVFVKVQGKIGEALDSQDWHVKEAGIVCLGALVQGADRAIAPHFKELFPFLLDSLDDQVPYLRATACWTLCRFTELIVEHGKQEPQLLQTYLQKILQKMMDENGRVQEASCSALSRFAYLQPLMMEKYVYDILEVIKHVYEHYQKKSLTNLYDVIASLASTIPKEKLQEIPVQNSIMEILMKKWDESPFNDLGSKTLVECTEGICLMIGNQSLANYAEFFLSRLLILIFNYIQGKKEDDRKFLFHKKEIALKCFDIFTVFLNDIGNKAEQFISPNDYLTIFHECVQDEDLQIRRHVLASGGEIAKFCPAILQGKVEKIAQAYMDNLYIVSEEYDAGLLYDACCNNSAWAIGEIALAYPTEFTELVPSFTQKLCDILNNESVKKTAFLNQNLSIAIGRLALVNPEGVSALLADFLKPFCQSLNKDMIDPEKQQAFRGLFLAISQNPNGIVKDFVHLCAALVNFENAEGDLHELGSKLVVNVKALAGQFWESYFVNFPQELQEKMKQRFGV